MIKQLGGREDVCYLCLALFNGQCLCHIILYFLIVVIVCPNLIGPPNGQVNVGSFSFGGVAHYSCASGFTMSGSYSRSCQESEQWSGISPTCILSKTGI